MKVEDKEGKVLTLNAEEAKPLKIKDTYGLFQGFSALLSMASEIDGGIMYAVEKNIKKLESKLKSIDRVRHDEIVPKYAKLDDKGKPALTVFPEATEEEKADPEKMKLYEHNKKVFRSSYIFDDPEKEKECEKAIEEFMESDAEIEFHKITIGKFESLKVKQNPGQPVPYTNLIVEHLIF